MNPQGGISLTTIISNVSHPGTTAPVNSLSTPSTTSTSGTRMSASADNGAARETFSSSFGEQRSSVGTDTNNGATATANTTNSSTSTSTQTSQPSVRTRIIVDDFIALVSNVPASMAAAMAAAQGGQVPSGMSVAQNQSQAPGQGAATATSTPVPTPGTQSTTAGQGQARPQGLPGAVSMNLMSGMGGEGGGTPNSNHPDPSLPCQSFHFGPQGQRAQPQQTSQPQSTQSTTTTVTSTPAQTPIASTAPETAATSTPASTAATTSASQTQPKTRGAAGDKKPPSEPPPAREPPVRTPPERRRGTCTCTCDLI